MSRRVLGVACSPRAGGNSDLLLQKALAGAESAGASIELLSLRDAEMVPCQECNACLSSGECPLDDDFPKVLEKLLACDCLIVATPVFFMSITAYAKALIERCQCLWARKYVLRESLFPGEQVERRAMLISVAGTRSEQMFECVTLSLKYWLDVLEMKHVSSLFVNQVDGKGDILKHAAALDEVFRLGRELVARPQAPGKVETIRLFEGLSNQASSEVIKD